RSDDFKNRLDIPKAYRMTDINKNVREKEAKRIKQMMQENE
ncbi:hypothetical protein, partial [Staphylococcus aureus]